MYTAELKDESYSWDPTTEILRVTKTFKNVKFDQGLRKVRVKVNFNKPAKMISHFSNIYREKIL
jgi:hypothetical protein